MRTQSEILARLKAAQPLDPFGFEWEEYVSALTRESIESLRGTLLKADTDLSTWDPTLKTDEDVRKQCVDYMEFAWEKANGCRGLSAGRSMGHYKAWLWLLGEDGFDDLETYRHYGKDNLVRICRFLALDPDRWDNHKRVNSDGE